MENLIEEILKTIFLFSTILLIVGLIAPKKVLFFIKGNKTRATVAKIFGSISGVFLIILIIVFDVDYYGKGVDNFNKNKFEKAIRQLSQIDSENEFYDSAQYYIDLAERSITYRDSVIAKQEADSLAFLAEQVEQRKLEEAELGKRLVQNFLDQIDQKTKVLDQACTKASQHLGNYGKGRSSANQTIEALDHAINICNDENIYSIKIPVEFDKSLNEQCDELLSAYSKAYSSKQLAFDYGKRAIQNGDGALLQDANRNAMRSLQELTDAVILNNQLRTDFGIQLN